MCTVMHQGPFVGGWFSAGFYVERDPFPVSQRTLLTVRDVPAHIVDAPYGPRDVAGSSFVPAQFDILEDGFNPTSSQDDGFSRSRIPTREVFHFLQESKQSHERHIDGRSPALLCNLLDPSDHGALIRFGCFLLL